MTGNSDPFDIPRVIDPEPPQPPEDQLVDQQLVDAQEAHEWLPVDPRFVTVERIGSWILTIILLLIGASVLTTIFVSTWSVGTGGKISIAIYCVLAFVLAWVSHSLPKLAHRHLRYRVGPLGFEIRRGILWRKQITVPLSRVQHTDVSQGPLERRFGIGKVVVYTAGTEHASIELPGVSFPVAESVRDSLVSSREATDGV